MAQELRTRAGGLDVGIPALPLASHGGFVSYVTSSCGSFLVVKWAKYLLPRGFAIRLKGVTRGQVLGTGGARGEGPDAISGSVVRRKLYAVALRVWPEAEEDSTCRSRHSLLQRRAAGQAGHVPCFLSSHTFGPCLPVLSHDVHTIHLLRKHILRVRRVPNTVLGPGTHCREGATEALPTQSWQSNSGVTEDTQKQYTYYTMTWNILSAMRTKRQEGQKLHFT